MLKRFIFVVIAILAANAAFAFENERLNYQIVYHWGIIWKHAASATLSLVNSNGNYESQLSARTISWADKIFKVRDTLTCQIKKEGFRPLRYTKSAHEGKGVVHDVVKYSYLGNVVNADCRHHRQGRQPQKVEFEAEGKAFDMLSVFYYIRTLTFTKMDKNTVYKVTVFSGRRKETLNIRYAGVENIKLRDGSRHDAYHIKFSFTQDGRQKSSDDMDTWISTDSSKIPLMLRGKLPIGEVRCYYAK